jgi:hypothetical protein
LAELDAQNSTAPDDEGETHFFIVYWLRPNRPLRVPITLSATWEFHYVYMWIGYLIVIW